MHLQSAAATRLDLTARLTEFREDIKAVMDAPGPISDKIEQIMVRSGQSTSIYSA